MGRGGKSAAGISFILITAFILMWPGVFVVRPYLNSVKMSAGWKETVCRVSSTSQAHMDYGVLNKKIRSWFVPCPPPPTDNSERADEDDNHTDDIFLNPCFTIVVIYKSSEGKHQTAILYSNLESAYDSLSQCSQRICVDTDFSDADAKSMEFVAEYGVVDKTFDCRYNPNNLNQTVLESGSKLVAVICAMAIPSAIMLIVLAVVCYKS